MPAAPRRRFLLSPRAAPSSSGSSGGAHQRSNGSLDHGEFLRLAHEVEIAGGDGRRGYLREAPRLYAATRSLAERPSKATEAPAQARTAASTLELTSTGRLHRFSRRRARPR
ncbi:hypothetical protein ACP70R_019833 [Stipagrostis hirtigluma subsp. patula]